MEPEYLPYSRFAYAYDDMMSNVNYRRWVNYVVELFHFYNAEPRRILDLACGTGSIAVPLAKAGYDVIGLDRAKEMMEVGESKARKEHVTVWWVEGDMRTFHLETTVDAALCLYDSINYALTLDELRQVFERVWDVLETDGLFIFDVTTERNIVEHFHMHTFAENEPNYTYIWKNIYSRYDKICRTELTFLIRREDNLFERFVETHLQKIFEISEIKRLLTDTGYEMLSAFDAWSFSKYHRNSDRINITARKRSRR